jgi:TolB-like protein/tRNA A-37 threonylcarbamoyl transferase component Bud32/Tfp pilus assembly protein PilF
MHEQHVAREAAEKGDASTTGICLGCGRPLTRMGPAGECLRCLVSLAFLPDEEPMRAGTAARRRVVPGSLSYAHFEVEVGEDGFPVELGAGAMAVTYRARDTILHTVVALKVVDRQMAENPVARGRFLREARAAAQLHHPNVARVTYYGEQDGECFYVMEFIEGETLEERVRRKGPMPLSLALEVILQASRALAAAEACGVVHRDIKPSNLMIASRQGEADGSDSLLVKMIDFGVAKVANTGIDQTRAGFIGTPAFASPEQFDGTEHTPVDTRSDIYSLGVTFWYLLSGRTPFTGRTFEEIRARQSQEPPLGQLTNAEVSAPAIGLLKSMLAVDPAARPQSARELLAAVYQCAKGGREEPARAEAEVRREEGFWMAVLPFKFSGTNAEIAVFAEGLTEEIVTALSRFPYLRVIARNSTARYLSESFDVRRIGNELGARYLMEGSLRQAGNKLRITAQLVDTNSGAHLWAETFDRDWQAEGIFTLQDEITDHIVVPVADVYGVLARAIAAATGAKSPEALTPYEAVWRFFLAQQRGNEEDHLSARIALEHAIELQPGYAEAWAALAILFVDEHRHLFNSRPHSLDRALSAAERAIDANSASQMANYAFAVAQYFRRDLGAFRAKAERALVLNPRSSYTFACLGRLICYSGEWERGIRLSTRAIELSPHHPGWYFMGIIVNEYRQRRYAAALAVLEKSNKQDYWVMHFLTAITQAQLGNLSGAQAGFERTLQAWPKFAQKFSRAQLQKWFFNQPDLVEHIMEGVKLAGFRLHLESDE